MNDIRFELKSEDRADDTDRVHYLNQPETEDVISALTESQMLEVLGKIGAAQRHLLRCFEQHMPSAVRSQIRMVYGYQTDAIRLVQAIVDSTRRS